MGVSSSINDAANPEGFSIRWFVPPKSFVHTFLGLQSRRRTRGLFVTNGGKILAVERSGKDAARIVYFADDDNDGVAEAEYTIVEQAGLTHSLYVYKGKIYASTPNALYRWSYSEGQTHTSTDREVVIANFYKGEDGSYSDGGHNTRTIMFDPHGRLYVSIGSANNVDGDSRRARLRRFDFPSKFFTNPLDGFLIDFSTGVVVADGLRNTMGMSFDRAGNLWGLDNGADGLVRPDLGGDIHMDNPADELNLLLRYRDDSSAGSSSSPSLSVTAAPTYSVDEVRSTYAPTPAEDMSTTVPSVGSNSSEGNLPNQSGTAAIHTYMKNDRFSLTEKNSSSSAAPTSYPASLFPSLLPSSSSPSSSSSTSSTTTTTTDTTTTTTTGPAHFGYPYCFTQYLLGGNLGHRGELWAWPSFLSDGLHTDEWCRRNTVPAALSIQAHSAPLGMTFFDATSTVSSQGSSCGHGGFPGKMDGDAFIALHGSWNRDTPTGFKVVRVPMKRTGGGVSVPNADGGPIDFLCSKGPGAEWIDQIRPVDVKFDGCKRLLVSTDGGSFSGDGILIVEYNRPAKLGDDSLSSKSFSNVTCGSGNPSIWKENNVSYISVLVVIVGIVPMVGMLGLLCLCRKYLRYVMKRRTSGIHRGVEFHELSQNDDSDIFDNAEGDFFRDVGDERGVEMLSSRH